MTLSGRNGSGKTTLLRMLAGETGARRGARSATRQGARVALHDQRPPRSRRDAARVRPAGLDWIAEIEGELAELEGRMADGDATKRRSTAYADAQARLEHAGGYRWRDSAEATLARPRLRRPTSSTAR